METKFKDIELLPFLNGKSKGDYFYTPINVFGKDCSQLYKIQGFCYKDGEWWVFASRMDKKTRKIAKNAPLIEGFRFETIFNS